MRRFTVLASALLENGRQSAALHRAFAFGFIPQNADIYLAVFSPVRPALR